MRTVRSKVVCLAGAAAFAALLWSLIESAPKHKERERPTLPTAQEVEAADRPLPEVTPPSIGQNLLNVARATNLSEQEKTELATNFREKYKPAVEKWFKAYDGRVPFHPEDLTLDNFSERLGRNSSFYLYTFVFNGITLTVQDSKEGAKVFYMTQAKGLKELNELPHGVPPTMQMPVNREDVARMVKADSGTEFKPNQILLRPTGLGTAVNGGALVDIGPRGGDPNIGPCKLSMAFGPDGNLTYYLRDPFF